MRRQVLDLAVMAWAVFGLAGVAAAQAPGGAGMAGGRQGGVPPIDVEWNDALPAGTADHAARALKESPRHGEWVDGIMFGLLKEDLEVRESERS